MALFPEHLCWLLRNERHILQARGLVLEDSENSLIMWEATGIYHTQWVSCRATFFSLLNQIFEKHRQTNKVRTHQFFFIASIGTLTLFHLSCTRILCVQILTMMNTQKCNVYHHRPPRAQIHPKNKNLCLLVVPYHSYDHSQTDYETIVLTSLQREGKWFILTSIHYIITVLQWYKWGSNQFI